MPEYLFKTLGPLPLLPTDLIHLSKKYTRPLTQQEKWTKGHEFKKSFKVTCAEMTHNL